MCIAKAHSDFLMFETFMTLCHFHSQANCHSVACRRRSSLLIVSLIPNSTRFLQGSANTEIKQDALVRSTVKFYLWGKKLNIKVIIFPPSFYIYIYISIFFLTKSVSEPATQCVLAAQCHWSSPVATSAGSKEVTHVKQSDSTQKSSLKPAKDTRQNK